MPERAANPSTEWYQQRLNKDRQAQRQGGVIAIVIGVLMLPAGAAVITWLFPQMVGKESLFNLIGLFVTMLGAPLAFILLGITQYFDGRQPVSLEDIEQRRQKERTE